MPVIKIIGKKEAERVKYCQGCKYFGSAGKYGCCYYYERTGKRRPCKFGEGCTVKTPDDSDKYAFGDKIVYKK